MASTSLRRLEVIVIWLVPVALTFALLVVLAACGTPAGNGQATSSGVAGAGSADPSETPRDINQVVNQDLRERIDRASAMLTPLWGSVATDAGQVVTVRVQSSGALPADEPQWVARVVGDSALPVIEVNVDAWAMLAPEARDFVIAHELTHVIARQLLGTAAPAWWEEGFAEFSARSVTAHPEGMTQALDWLPDRVPTSADFYGTQADAAYAVAASMVGHAFELGATATLADLYQLAAGASAAENPEALLDRRLRSQLETSTAELLAHAVAEAGSG